MPAVPNAGQNYGFMFIGYTLASFISQWFPPTRLPPQAATVHIPFLGALCIVGLVLLSLAWMFFKKMKLGAAGSAGAYVLVGCIIQ